MPRPNLSTGYTFTRPPADRFSVDCHVLQEPPLPQAFYYHTSFWLDAPGGFTTTSSYGRGGYFGLQRLFASGLHKAIFSLWDDTVRGVAGQAVPLKLHPEDIRTPSDGGWGAHTGTPYPWIVGRIYRFTLQRCDGVPSRPWTCILTDLSTMEQTVVGAITAEGTLAGWCMSHYETLGGGPDCVGHGPAVVLWEHWQPTVTVQGPPFWEGTCPAQLLRGQVGNELTAYILR